MTPIERDPPLTRNLAASTVASRIVEGELRFHAKRLATLLARPGAPVLTDDAAFARLCNVGLARRALLELSTDYARLENSRRDMVEVIDLDIYALLGRNPTNDALGEQERAHLLNLCCGYGSAVRYCRILRRYQEGRLRDRDRSDTDGAAAFTAHDAMLASTDEED